MIQRRKHLQHRTTEYQLKNRCFSLRNPDLAKGRNSLMTIGPKDTTTANPIYNMEASIDGINWVVLDKSFHVPNLRRVYVRVRDGYEYSTLNDWNGINFCIEYSLSSYYLLDNYQKRIRGTELSGNILTLLYRNPNTIYTSNSDDIEELPLPLDAFTELFTPIDSSHAPALEAEKLLLPSKIVSERAYQRMFYQSSLMTPPIIKAKTVHENGMDHMFANSELLFPPLLQVEICDEFGMYGMFKNCTKLVIGFKDPYVLPRALYKSSCAYMFSGCGFIFQTPFMPATILKDNCYNSTFKNCEDLYCIFSSAQSKQDESGVTTPNLYGTMTGMFDGASQHIDSDGLNAYYTFGVIPDGESIVLPNDVNWNQMKFKASGINSNQYWRDVDRAIAILQHDFTDYTAQGFIGHDPTGISMAQKGGWNPRNPLACAKCIVRHYIFEGDINWPTWNGVPLKDDYPPETWPDYTITPP